MNLSLRPGCPGGSRPARASHGSRPWSPTQIFELKQARDVAGQLVDLEVERVADDAFAHGGDSESVRYETYREAANVDGIDRKADAVEAGRALDRDKGKRLPATSKTTGAWRPRGA